MQKDFGPAIVHLVNHIVQQMVEPRIKTKCYSDWILYLYHLLMEKGHEHLSEVVSLKPSKQHAKGI